MGVLTNLAQGDADTAHDWLTPAISNGMPASHSMTGSLALTSADKQTVHYRTTANFSGEQHVELQLMAMLFERTKAAGTPFTLPANSRVYLYVYDSPCTACTDRLRLTLRLNWGTFNPTVRWKLGFSKWFLLPAPNGHASPTAATQAYNTVLVPAGWTWKQLA